MIENIIIGVILTLVVGGAIFYIYKAKKNGKKCIGCPDSGSCEASKCASCSCGCQNKDTE